MATGISELIAKDSNAFNAAIKAALDAAVKNSTEPGVAIAAAMEAMAKAEDARVEKEKSERTAKLEKNKAAVDALRTALTAAVEAFYPTIAPLFESVDADVVNRAVVYIQRDESGKVGKPSVVINEIGAKRTASNGTGATRVVATMSTKNNASGVVTVHKNASAAKAAVLHIDTPLSRADITAKINKTGTDMVVDDAGNQVTTTVK
jgi:hypothetical protein